MKRRCLGCKRLFPIDQLVSGSYCHPCNAARYGGTYPKRARHVRATATHCAICGGGPRPDDPWTAHHPKGSRDLVAAHRSCNILAGDR